MRLRAALAFSEDANSALVAKIAAGVAWVPDHVGDLQTPDVEHRSEFSPDDNGDDMQPLRVLVQMAQVSVPKVPYVIVWGRGSCLAGPNISVVHTFGNLQRKFIKPCVDVYALPCTVEWGRRGVARPGRSKNISGSYFLEAAKEVY